MDVVLVIILLFSAFSLGSATRDGADNTPAGLDMHTTMNEQHDPLDKGIEAAEVEDRQWRECIANRHCIIYRDLTVPHKNEIETEMNHVSDSKDAVSDE